MTTSEPFGSPARRTHRSWRAGLLLGLVAAAAMPLGASAQADDDVATGLPPVPTVDTNYVTTTAVANQSLDVSAFSPVCIRNAPFISYTIVPVGFTPVNPTATLVVKTVTGSVLETISGARLSGTFIWPGATVNAAGQATDWPGWKLAPDGVSWIPDPRDAITREGLVIEVTVVPAPTATATVSYPANDSPCANPPHVGSPTATTVAPCVPGQNNDGTPADDCTLPRTGGGPGNTAIIGAAALLAGLLLLTAARRRRNDMTPEPS